MKAFYLKHVAFVIFFLLMFCAVSRSQQGIPQYANAEARWQWRASSDGITYIPVCWENPASYTTEMQWVRSAVERTWQSVANVSFYGWGQCVSGSQGIRIQITDVRPNSHIGTDLNNRRNFAQSGDSAITQSEIDRTSGGNFFGSHI
jgi:hypothetical protein